MLLRCTILLLVVAMAVDAVDIKFRNECGRDMILSDGRTSEKLEKHSDVVHKLNVGAIRAYRYSKTNQATLAEFSIQETTTWYDISIIPTTYERGPGNCSSLEQCKEVTGGVGFNVAMKIIPRFKPGEFYHDRCRTLTCLADGCEAAYHFPSDPFKTHNCPSDLHFTVVFCASESTGSSDSSLGWEDLNESGNIDASVLNSTRVPTPKPTEGETKDATTGAGGDDDDTNAVAVIIASMIGGFILFIAAVFLSRKIRYLRLERMNSRQYPTTSVGFVEARDAL